MLLHDATAFTIDLESWKVLATLHSRNKQPTKVVIFEPKGTHLNGSGEGCNMDGGHLAFEFDLNLIALYLDRPDDAPILYKLLFHMVVFGEDLTERLKR